MSKEAKEKIQLSDSFPLKHLIVANFSNRLEEKSIFEQDRPNFS
ncbi:hypothetical protein [Halalkalibacter sp. APA_J-10(15)]|nr:hypothetical protein [Halalkalibacter sp. APA_J-10(15)]